MRNKIYKKLRQAQDICFKANETKLFDLCEYHFNIVYDEELNEEDLEQLMKFAKDVYKIATLKNNLEPLV
tara:strand:- start:598 stop:807 length:210 start_codon:yes stop_codon:yes gene_type:complete